MNQSVPTTSAFQKLFEQRAQGFHIEFRFRNAPPRPPVGPCFVGKTIDAVLQEESRQYKALNAVEVNHRWKLHAEKDLGVPLAPSAMDLNSYTAAPDENEDIHPDDIAILDWKGSMGDTAADDLKLRQDQARAAARAALQGKILPFSNSATKSAAHRQRPSKKAFSRVLDEDLQTWMKKTTYLSNDYSRKVHDFKSLAQSKKEIAQDLQLKQEELSKRRSARSVLASFNNDAPLTHPTRKNLKPKQVFDVLPNVSQWGKGFTHVVLDKPPAAKNYEMKTLNRALVANVEKPDANARMTCQLFVPSQDEPKYRSISTYDLDVIPLKDEDSPSVHFCLWVDRDTSTASYFPLSSRVQLSAGRPAKVLPQRTVNRRELNDRERVELEERRAEVDRDLAEQYHMFTMNAPAEGVEADLNKNTERLSQGEKENDDGEDDFGDDDDDESSGDEALFGGATKTIVAES